MGVGARGFRQESSTVYRGRPVTSVSVLTEGQRSAGSSELGQGCFRTDWNNGYFLSAVVKGERGRARQH